MADNIHKVGEAARKALSALKSAKASKKRSVAKFHDLIEDRNETAKELLTQVRDHIQTVGAVNGCTTWEGWAEHAGWSKRALNYIISGRPERGGNRGSRVVTLKEGLRVKVGKHEITLDEHLLTLLIEHGAEPKEVEDDEVTAPTAKVLHAKFSKLRSLCESRMPNRPIEKGKKYAATWGEATCPDCVRIIETAQKNVIESDKKKEKLAAQSKTHKMQPGDTRTYCGKTPSQTLAKDAPMDDLPTCRGCQSGEEAAKARAADVKSKAVVNVEKFREQHPAAKALAAAEKANKRSKGTIATPAATAATTGLVKIARIGNTHEFGVFPESCWKCTTANALTIGTREKCEAERDRINAKRPAKNDSVENLVAHGDAHQNEQQHPAAEALEKALDSTEALEVSDEQHDEEECDYTEEQVAAMFVQGGN